MMKFSGILLLAGMVISGGALAENESGEPLDFDRYDANGDGFLTETEWSEVPVPVDFHDVDVNRDGQVEEAELLQGYPWHVNEFVDEEPYNDADPEGSFGFYDANDDGLLDENEFSDAGWTDDDFGIWDADDDGFLDEDEVNDGWFEDDNDTFDTFDANDDGAVDENEVTDYDYVDYNFDVWDENEDGVLDEDEADMGWQDKDEGLYDEEGY